MTGSSPADLAVTFRSIDRRLREALRGRATASDEAFAVPLAELARRRRRGRGRDGRRRGRRGSSCAVRGHRIAAIERVPAEEWDGARSTVCGRSAWTPDASCGRSPTSPGRGSATPGGVIPERAPALCSLTGRTSARRSPWRGTDAGVGDAIRRRPSRPTIATTALPPPSGAVVADLRGPLTALRVREALCSGSGPLPAALHPGPGLGALEQTPARCARPHVHLAGQPAGGTAARGGSGRTGAHRSGRLRGALPPVRDPGARLRLPPQPLSRAGRRDHLVDLRTSPARPARASAGATAASRPGCYRIAANELASHYRRAQRQQSERGQRAARQLHEEAEPSGEPALGATTRTLGAQGARAAQRALPAGNHVPLPVRSVARGRRARHGPQQGHVRRRAPPGPRGAAQGHERPGPAARGRGS